MVCSVTGVVAPVVAQWSIIASIAPKYAPASTRDVSVSAVENRSNIATIRPSHVVVTRPDCCSVGDCPRIW